MERRGWGDKEKRRRGDTEKMRLGDREMSEAVVAFALQNRSEIATPYGLAMTHGDLFGTITMNCSL